MLQFLRRLFKGQKPDADWQPLQRSAAEQRAYAQWVADEVYRNWLGPYFKAYHYCKAGLPPCHGGLRVQRLESCGQHGALLLYDAGIGVSNFRHLFDLLRDRTQALGYHLAASDVRTRQHPRYQETIAKHFLKPTPHDCPETGRCQQRFGTVTIDLVSLNGKPGFIRLVCNPIQDEMFCPAFSFDEFMNALFNVSSPAAAPVSSGK
ncbi:hypothetical protein [Hymenobacter sp. CRA2]|uniref:hypothetical protein n=1 Tax=Hymenobacter sp. CRA2 TaxID=1955620 RepID=UPI00098E9B2D|nr:hypothetical protein [Hymenobacter sp. CRA2]OON70036.1 hypothetical protein B0919_04630 [Hymenobacter sp. CRA2]